jgi:catechol 2,3-dioxygenase-like lactoylglutathione lyase family enzyme
VPERAALRLRRLDHAGIPVSDLDRSLRFYRDVFGVAPEFVTEYGDPSLASRLRVQDPRIKVAMITMADGLRIELLQYLGPEPKRLDLRDCDVGSTHLCLEVDDIDDAHRALKQLGVDVYADPFLETEPGPFQGTKWLFFKDPDDVSFELVQLPDPTSPPSSSPPS